MKFIYTIIAFIFCLNISAQEKNTVEHFDSIVSNSNTYSNKKIINISELEAFKTELVSAQDSLNNSIEELNSQIDQKDTEINRLTSEKENLRAELEKVKSNIDNINLFGIPILKSTYQIIVWLIILLLIITIGVIIFQSRSIRLINNELKENLDNINQEFESYKQIALEKQQKMGRELLDVKKKLNPNK